MSTDLEAQLRAVFQEEANETFDALRVVFAQLRTRRGEAARTRLTDAVRHAHNLKGAAGSVGLTSMADVAHALEDALVALRETNLSELEASVARFELALSRMEASLVGGDDGSELAVAREQLAALAACLVPQGSGRDSSSESSEAETAEAALQQGVAAEEEAEAAPDQVVQDSTWKGASVRVETTRLDRLFGFASQILVTGTDMERRQDTLERLREEVEALVPVGHGERGARVRQMVDGLVDDHYRALGAFGRLSAGLAAAMRRARMVPLQGQAPWLRRVVADTARVLEKPVDLQLELGNIELDRAVLDRLRDPLMHLLRNAVDHGIDGAEDRELFGKPPRGMIGVFARMRGSAVELVVADDGRGFDLAAIKRRAVQEGLVDAAGVESKTEAEVLGLLFAEGFSTRTETNTVSGRGVGLHVVARTVGELGGTLRAAKRGPLGGAAFVLTVPLSILSTRLLLVRAGEMTCGVPVHAIERVARIGREEVHQVGGVPMASFDEQTPVPLHWLARSLGQRLAREPESMHVLFVDDGDARVALAVDEVLHETDQVVHRLPWNLEHVPGVSGAVPMADGTVTVVVDTAHLFSVRGEASFTETRGGPKSATRILVVDDSMTTRTLHHNLLAGAGYDVRVANDGDEAWKRLHDEPIDVVVSDVQMPGLDGFELTRRMRAEPRLAAVPVVLVTSLGGPDDVQRGLDAGADEYVVKGPLEQDVLLSAVRRHAG